MREKLLIIYILFVLFDIYSLSGHNIESTEGIWFNGSTTLKANAYSDFMGSSMLTMENSFDFRTNPGNFPEVEITVTETGSYSSMVYNIYVWGYEHRSTKNITVYKDVRAPTSNVTFLTDSNTGTLTDDTIFTTKPSYMLLNITDQASQHDVLNPNGLGKIIVYSVKLKKDGSQIGECYYPFELSAGNITIKTIYEDNIELHGFDEFYGSSINNLGFYFSSAIPTSNYDGYYELEVYAKDAADHSYTNTYTFIIDSENPSLNVSHYNDNYDVTSGPVTVLASASDNLTVSPTIQWRYSGENTWTDFDSTGVPVTQNSILEFKAIDNAGNESSIVTHYINNIDSEPPEITYTGDFNTLTNTPYSLTINYIDVGSTHSSGIGEGSIAEITDRKYKFNIYDNWSDYSGPIPIDSNRTVYVMAEDSVGNKIGDDHEEFLEIENFDIEPPVFDDFEISSENSVNGYTAGPVYITASTTDNDPLYVNNIEFQYQGKDEWFEYTGPVPVYTNNSTVKFRATDMLGNSTGDNDNLYTVRTIDDRPPSLTYRYSPTSYTNNSVTVTVESIEDTQSGVFSVDYRIGDDQWITVQYEDMLNNTFTFDVINNVSRVQIRTTDNVGNITDDNYKEFNVNIIDKSDPEITDITLTPTSDVWTYGNVSIAVSYDDEGVSGKDDSRMSYRIADDDTWNLFPMQDITENCIVTIRVYDNAGNYDEEDVSISNIDSSSPVIEVKGNSDVWTDSKTLTAVASDPESDITDNSFKYNDGNGWLDYSQGEPITVSSNKTVQFKVTNGAGESTTVSEVIEYIDSNDPDINNPFFNNARIFSEVISLKSHNLVFEDSSTNVTGYYYFHNDKNGLTDSEVGLMPNDNWLSYTDGVDISSESISNDDKWFYLKAVDDVGNTTYADFSIEKDNIIPTVSFSLQFNEEGSNDTKANSKIIYDEISVTDSNLESYSYIIRDDSGEDVKSGTMTTPTSKLTVDISNLPEGSYSAEIFAIDAANNPNAPSLDFVIDRMPPEIDDVTLEISMADTIYGENDITTSGGLSMLFANPVNGIDNPRYKYYVTKTPPAAITDLDSKLTDYTASSTITFVENIGLYYVYYYIIDDAGNWSDNYTYRTIRYNNKNLPVPDISGVKKATSLTDVIIYDSPVFTFSPTLVDHEGDDIDYGDLSITGFEYKLFKGVTADVEGENSIDKGFIEVSNGSIVNKTFKDLDDNAAGEYYILYIRAKSNRDDYSSYTQPYKFRIDTQPPENLTVMSSSHPNSDTAYSGSSIVFYWDNPQDMTGVETYKYYISEDGSGSDPGDNSLITVNGDRRTLVYNLPDNKDSGSIFMHVEAIDYGGLVNEENTNTLEVRINRVIPTVEITGVDNNPDELKTTVYWSVSDAYSQTLVLEDGENSITRTLTGDVNSFTMDGLIPEVIYTVKIYGHSNAQPSLTSMDYTQFEVTDETDTMLVPAETEFTTQFSGYRIDGEYNTDDFNEASATLFIPESLTFIDNEEVISEIELHNVIIDDNGEFESGESEINLVSTVHGFVIEPGEPDKLIIDNEDGLELTNRVISYPINMSDTYDFSFPNLYIQDAVLVGLSGNVGNVSSENPINIQTTVNGIDTWLIEDITNISLEGNNLKLHIGSVNITGIGNLTLSNILLDHNREYITANIANDFDLTFGSGSDEITVSVTDAQLVGDKLVILQAIVNTINGYSVFDADGESVDIKISNLRIDQYGEVQTQPTLVEPFYIQSGDTKQFYVETLHFSNTGMKGNGYVTISGLKVNNSDFSDLGITGSGLSSIYRGTLDSSLTFVTSSGYSVTASGPVVSITTQGYHLSSADVDLSVFQTGKTITIYDMVIDLSFTEILQAGSTTLDTVTTSTTLPNLSYFISSSDILTIEEIELSEAGMVAKNVTMGLPSNFTTASLIIDEIPLTINTETNLGVFGRGSVKNSITSLELSSGYTITPTGAYYENGQVVITNYALNLPVGSINSSLTLTNMVFNHYGFEYDTIAEDIVFSDSNWTFVIHNPVLISTGITGNTTLYMPVSGINHHISLDDVLLSANGSYTLNKTETLDSRINIGGYIGVISGIEISGNQLKIDKLTFSYEGNELEIEDIILNTSGEITDYGSGKVGDEFRSRNGFVIKDYIPSLSATGLSLSGKVELPEYFGGNNSITLGSSELKFDTDWNLLTNNITEEHSVEINGVSATIDDFIFLKDGLFVESISIFEADQIITISNALITAENSIVSGGYLNDTHISRRIAGWPLVVTSAHLIEEGIELSSVIELPEELGSPTVYLEDMLLYYGDGIVKFRSNTVINALEFEVNDISFEMERVRLNPDYLSITNTNITLPVNDTFDGQTIGLSYLKIDKNGNFQLSGSEVNPIPMWGLEVYIKNFSLGDSELDIEGSVLFPNDFSIYELAGQKVTIAEFNHNFSTLETVFEVELDQISVEITEGWTTEFSSLNVSSTGFCIGQGELFFPNNWLDNISIESTGFTNLSYDFNTDKFDIGQIFINDLEVDCEGYQFTITSASFSGDTGFTLGGRFPLPGLFEGAEEDPVLIVETLQIMDDFSIQQLTAGIDVTNLSFTENRELLFSGYIGVDTSQNDLNVDLSGIFTVGSTFSVPSMIGSEIKIETFRFDILNGEITTLSASYINTTQDLFGLTIDDFLLGLSYTKDNPVMTFSLGGSTLLPATYPGIGEERFSLSGGFDTTGKLLSFSSGLTIAEDKPFVSDLTLKAGSNISMIALINDNDELSGFEFSLNNAVVKFSNTFSIESLRGGDIGITSLIIDTYSGFKSCNMSFDTPDNMDLLNNIVLKSGSISLSAEGTNSIQTTITGVMQLPDNMGGMEIAVNTFTVDSNGNFIIDAEGYIEQATLFNQLELTGAEIKVSAVYGVAALTFDVGGKLSILNPSIPANIRSSSLVAELTFSTNNGLEYFNAGLEMGGAISYSLMDGVTVSLDSLNFNADGFSSEASLTVRDGFFGLDGEVITTGDITMNWDGEITDSDLRIAYLSLEYASMGLSVSNLRMNEEGINFETALIQLPDALGSQVVGVENGGIDSGGNFYGDFVVGVLTVDILGCLIELHKPELDKETEEITCESAVFVLPEALGSAEIGLNDVSIGSSGLNISGGSFTLPDINAGGLQFSNMGATLIIDGDNYEIGATGKVFVAGVGEVEAEISLVNIQRPDYPIGLKYAYFGFETKVGGLPLGTTGLLLTGVRGGLAFGPPGADLPEYYRNKFGSGMRIELGVTIVDASYTMRGTSDLWMNVENFDFALRGELDLLDSLFSVWAEALYTQTYGLELSAGIDRDLIDRLYIEGVIRAHIFEEAEKARLCADITANVSVKNIWNGLPEDPYSLGSIGLEAGDFKDNRRGVKGYVTVDLFGTKGVYYGTDGTFAIGNVDQYTLLDADMRSLRSSNILRATTDRRYRLVSSTPQLQKRSGGTEPVNSNRERIIFYIKADEGDPILTAISPSGVRYSEGDDNVLIRRLKNKVFLAVVNPEDGEWSMEVSNLVAGSDYEVDAIGFFKNPEITLETPTFNRELVEGSYTVEGSFQGHGEEENIISIYVSRERGVFNGQEIATFVADSNSSFSHIIETSHLDNGEYYLYAGIYDGKNPELYNYAEGSIIVNNDLEEMAVIDDLIAGVTDNRVINISFTNPNGKKVKGFHLNITNNETGEEELLNLGYLTKFILSTLKDANSYTLAVTPYDNMGRLGEVSNEVLVDFSSVNEIHNTFEVTASSVDIELDYDSETSIVITPLSYTATGSSMDYAELIIDEIPDFITYSSSVERVKLDGVDSFDLSLICLSELDEVKTQPGEYSISGRLRNIGNDSIEESFVIPVSIGYKTPEITNISPETWHITDGTTLEIKGKGFYEESTVNIGGKDCEILDQNPTTLWVTVPVLTADNSGILNISNHGNENGTKEIELIRPSYSVSTIKDYTEITPGGRGWLYSRIKSYNRFDETVSFGLIDHPEGWNITISEVIVADQNFVMEVLVPDSASTGYYTVTVENYGEEKEYYISVVDSYPNPTISALSSHAGNWGEIITIYGYGITPETEIMLNHNSLETYEQSEDYIRFMIPDDAINGILSLQRGELTSNGAEFEIKDDNFNIYPTNRHYDLKPGAEVSNRVFVRGYADYVNLELVTDTPDITVVSNRNFVTPNGDFEMDIMVSDTIDTGLYHITITGSCERNVKEQVITISVGDNIQFTDKTLTSGKIDMEYSDYLEVENSINDYTFHLSENSYLPHGLFLNSETGEIYGRPTQSGMFIFSTNVFESELRQNKKEFELLILDSGWSRVEGPDGNNRFNNITSPAEDKTIWENAESDSVETLLSSGDNLYSIKNSEIRVLNRFTGLTKYILEVETLKTQLLGPYIINLENRYNYIYNEEAGEKEPEFEDSYLVIYQQDGGEELISYSGVTDFDTVNSVIYMEQHGSTVILPVSDLENTNTIEENIFENESTTTENGIYSIVGNSIINNITGNVTELSDTPYSFTTLDNQLYYVDNLGTYVEFSTGMETLTGITDSKLAVGELFSVIYNNYEFVVIDRYTKETVRNTTVIDELLLTKDKLYILNSEGLTAYNLYTGDEIWNRTGNFSNLISGGSYLYLQEDVNNIICIGGRSNISAPTTSFQITPAEPDGTNGYYSTNPVFELTVTDPESYGIAEYSTDDTTCNRYTDPVTLLDGVYTLSYNSYDDEGLTEELAEVPLKVDTMNPASTMDISKTDGTNGYTISHVTYTLSATDENSGIYQIWYSINGDNQLYTEPVTIDQEGDYTFEWWSIDMAGNVEPNQQHTVSIDLFTPVTTMEIEKTDGTNGHITSPVTYTLSSTDSYSGVYQTWYSLNGETELYTEPVFIDQEGNYTFEWWSIDMAGNTEPKQEDIISIDLYTPETSMEIEKIDGANGHITSPITYTISSTDSRSGLYQTWFSINGNDQLYTEPVTISQEGNYTFEWWSIDIAGNVEPKQEDSISIDLNTPVTTMDIEKTDGTNGHITSPVTYTLSSTDSYSGVYQTWYSINGNDHLYTEPVTILEEGNYTFKWWSIDMAGNTEPKQEDIISIDLYNPEITMEVEKTDGDRGYTISPVTYTLSTTDSHSGVYQTWYSINGEHKLYTEPVLIDQEGDYTFDWWSIDMAGNIEVKQSHTVAIDLNNPTISYESYEEREFSSIYFFAEDSFSGVNRIKYRINGSEIQNYHDPLYLPIGETYNVTYRSVDNSERVSEWFDIVMDLSTIEPVALIQNLTTAWSNRVISVDQEMQLGDEFYTKKNKGDKRDNTIKSLPSYLVGGELILNEYNNKNSWDKNFYQFNAGVTIDLYLVRNKDSELDLDDSWTLVDQDVEINDEFYPGGGDVYHKIVEEGEYVEIGGSKIWKKSGPNLIVAQRNAKADINIFSPNPAKDLTPLSTNWYAATSVEGEISRNWSYRLYGEEWVYLGNSFSGEFDLGYFTDDTTLEVRVEIITQNPVDSTLEDVVTKTRIYTVDNKAELTVIEPVSGSQILKTPTPLDFITTDVYGDEIEAEVYWITNNGVVTSGSYTPEITGVSTVTGSFEIYEYDFRKSSVQLNVVEEYETETFTFGLGDTGSYSERENGRYYGFSSDHSSRLGETTYVDVPHSEYWSNDRVTRSYIALRDNENFSYLVNNGTYRVTAVVGPVNRREDPYLRVEGEMIFIDAPSYSQIYNIETTAHVTDNQITIEGSEDLQILELQILRTNEPRVTAIMQQDNYRVMKDMKWYKWDPGYYYPDLKWDWAEEVLVAKNTANSKNKKNMGK